MTRATYLHTHTLLCALLIAIATLAAAPSPTAASTNFVSRTPSSLSRLRSHAHAARDAYTDLRMTQDGGDGPMLTSVGARPAGAVPTTIPIQPGADLFAWQSKTPTEEADAKEVFIILHGVKRNANTYFSILNNAWAKARDDNYGNADADSIRLAPLLFSAKRDADAINATTLAWDDPNVWTGGDGSVHPPLSGVSVFTVLDKLLERYADRKAYPKMRRVTFIGHGGAGQVISRYAILGRDSPSSKVPVRYVVGDPSSMLYFTRDRPVPVDTKECAAYNDFRYGFEDYRAPYSLEGRSQSKLFKRYVARDVRYAVGEEDTRIDKGDQSCMGRAAGGPYRRDRSLNYWAYLFLLAGSRDVPKYPGWFPALDSDPAKAMENKNSTGYVTAKKRTHGNFKLGKGESIQHRFHTVPGAGHSAKDVFGSEVGRAAVFGE